MCLILKSCSQKKKRVPEERIDCETTREAVVKAAAYFAIVTTNSQRNVHSRFANLVTDEDPRGPERVMRDAKRGRTKGLTAGKEIRATRYGGLPTGGRRRGVRRGARGRGHARA